MPRKCKKKTNCNKIDINKAHEFSEKQKELVEKVVDTSTEIVFVEGPAGTSKTYMATYCGLKLLFQKQVDGIIYIRSLAQSGKKDIGALPGHIEEKFEPFIEPLIDKMYEFVGAKDIEALLYKNRQVEGVPVNYLRGKDFKNKCIIVDEAQNMDFDELTTVITRFGEGSVMLICGDMFQDDIKKSALGQFINAFSGDDSEEQGIFVHQFDNSDIVRSRILKFITRKLENEKRSAAQNGNGQKPGKNRKRLSDWSPERGEVAV